MKKKLLSITAPFLCLGVAAHAADLDVSGQINRAVMAVDDGEKTETYFVDNTNSSTRFRFIASGEINENIEVGARLEMEFESNPSSAISRQNPSISSELQERHADIFFLGPFGEVYLGQGDGAANGITHKDQSGTGVVALLGHAHLMGGGSQFLNDGQGGPTVSQSIANFDFESRYDRVAYRTNQFGPLTLAASIGRKDDMVYETSAVYASEFGFGKVLTGIGYSSEQVEGAADSNDTLGGSASILLNSGFNVAISYSRLDADADYTSENTTLRLGYKAGRHATALDYGMTEDRAQDGDEGTYIGLNYVYKPIGWLELYGTGRVFKLDRDDADFDDITLLALGSRIKF